MNIQFQCWNAHNELSSSCATAPRPLPSLSPLGAVPFKCPFCWNGIQSLVLFASLRTSSLILLFRVYSFFFLCCIVFVFRVFFFPFHLFAVVVYFMYVCLFVILFRLASFVSYICFQQNGRHLNSHSHIVSSSFYQKDLSGVFNLRILCTYRWF